jgi:RNA 2',3'-cyclic 3'-phosphodiesterase
MSNAPAMLRLFIALWPDDATRVALLRLQPGLDGIPTRARNLHLTLAFLGMQPACALPQLCAILAGVPAQALTLELDSFGYFRRARIAWAGMSDVPPALLQLERDLMQPLLAGHFIQQAMQHSVLQPESRFTPHVTLARRTSAPALDAAPFAPIQWRASELALVESAASGDYLLCAVRQLTAAA